MTNVHLTNSTLHGLVVHQALVSWDSPASPGNCLLDGVLNNLAIPILYHVDDHPHGQDQEQKEGQETERLRVCDRYSELVLSHQRKGCGLTALAAMERWI